MSDLVRFDAADYIGPITANGGIVPISGQTTRDNIQAIDCRHWNSASVQISGTFLATLTFQMSNDGVNWLTVIGTSNGGLTAATSSGPGIFIVPISTKYFRVQCTAYTSGTAQVNINMSSTTPISTNSTVTISGTPNVATSPQVGQGFSSWSHIVSAATTNATSVKASAGIINDIVVSNNGAGVAYFKLYDKASAPTVGTDTPIATILIPINGTVVIPAGWASMRLGTGIAYAITGGAAVADVTAVTAAQVVGTINYA